MKLIKLAMQAFGPYRDHTEIDFMPFYESGMLCIRGQTGSGKTAILDALTYSLYGLSSTGVRGHIEHLRCHHAKHREPTVVSLELQTSMGRYRFDVQMEMKKKRTGEIEPSTVTHMIYQYKQGAYQAIQPKINKRVLELETQRIIGLTYEQFCQVVILPQGGFARFLMANSESKEAVLNTLFKADQYDQIAGNLSNKLIDIKTNLYMTHEKIETICQLNQVESLEALQHLIKVETQKIQLLDQAYKVAEQRYKNSQQLLQIGEQLKADFDRYEALQKEATNISLEAESIQTKEKRLHELTIYKLYQSDLELLSKQTVQFKQIKIEAKSVQSKLNEMNQMFSQMLSAEIERKLRKQIEIAEHDGKTLDVFKLPLQTFKVAAEKLIKAAHLVSDLKDGCDAIYLHKESYDALCQVISEQTVILEQYAAQMMSADDRFMITQTLTTVQAIEALIDALEVLKNEKSHLCRALGELDETLEQYKAEEQAQLYSDWSAHVSLYRSLLDHADNCPLCGQSLDETFIKSSQLDSMQARTDDLIMDESLNRGQVVLHQRTHERNQVLEPIKKAMTSIIEQQQVLNRKLGSIQSDIQYKNETLNNHQMWLLNHQSQLSKLVPNFPIYEEMDNLERWKILNSYAIQSIEMLCQKDQQDQIKLTALKKDLEDHQLEKNKQYETILAGETLLSSFRSAWMRMKLCLDDYQDALNLLDLDGCQTSLYNSSVHLSSIAQLIESISVFKMNHDHLRHYLNELNQLSTDLDEAKKDKWTSYVAQFQKLDYEAEINRVQIGALSFEQLIHLLQDCLSMNDMIQTLILNGQSILQALKNEVEAQIKSRQTMAAHIMTQQQALDALAIKSELYEDQISNLSDQIFQIEQKEQIVFKDIQVDERIETEIKTLEKTIRSWHERDHINQLERLSIETKIKDQTMPDMHQLKSTVDEQEVLYRQAFSEKEKTEKNIQHMKAHLIEGEALKQKHQAQREHYHKLKAFTELIQGRHGTSLKRFVLAHLMKDVLKLANERLQDVHQGRYQMDITDQKQGREQKTGLSLIVFDHHTQQRRSVQTLSGGEQFLLSLALALAFSEIVQMQVGAVAIQTMFVDEGFGTLDQTSLKEAMQMLMKGERSDQLVGMITHVETLEEMIPNIIYVHKTKQGSHIEVR